MIFKWFLLAYITVIGYGTGILELPKRHLLFSGFIGASGWLVYQICQNNGFSVPIAAFTAALIIALTSHIFARLFKSPVTVYLIAGVFPLVPGASIYRAVYYLMKSESLLAHQYLQQALLVSGAIAMAVFIVDSLFRLMPKQNFKIKK